MPEEDYNWLPKDDILSFAEIERAVRLGVGRVIADSTRLDPPTTSRNLNRQLIREASEWMFRPAVQEGQAVASWYPYRIIG